MLKIFIATTTFGQLSEEPLDLIRENGLGIIQNKTGKKIDEDEIIEMVGDAIGIIAGTETYSKSTLENLSNLKIISRLGVGMDNIDLGSAEKKDIKVYRTVTTPAPAVAELALGLMIDISRHISQTNHLLKSGSWEKKMGYLLQGKTLGIIGLGTIGKELVNVAKGFNLHIIAFDKYEDISFAKKHSITYCDLESLLNNSDIISIHLNLSDQTKRLIDKDKIKLMKPEAILINTSRGEIVDEKAIYDALKSNQIAGAGLDVFNQEPYFGPLTELDNVVLTPHIGAYARKIRIQMEIEAAENLIKGLNEAK